MTVEQLDAVEDFLAGDNVTIRANYGSGKTTTIMHAYNEVERVGGQALCMVYNSSMKLEMK
jgi:superfamily II DNA or RNA helicase